MILQLCLGFSVLVWLLICPSILERADYRARQTLAFSIEQTQEKYPQFQVLSPEETLAIPQFVHQKVAFAHFYPSNLWLALSLLLANTTSLLLLLGYRLAKWLCLPSMVLMLLSFSHLPLPQITHPLLDPRQTHLEEGATFEQAQALWQNQLMAYYHSKTGAAPNNEARFELSKQLFEYDLLKSPEPILGGFFFPASFWIGLVILLHGFWVLYLWRCPDTRPFSLQV